MKLLTLNCNGYRSASSKGLKEFLKEIDPDIISLQEIKANEDQIERSYWESLGYHVFANPAEKSGYSGVAVFSKSKPKDVHNSLNHATFDREGRYLQLKFPNFVLENIYFPSGTSGDERQSLKMEFLEFYFQLQKKEKSPNRILCGDVNIAHTERDIHNPKGNVKNSGFLPEEREWVNQFLDSGWVDAYRRLNPQSQEYSWWTYRFQARVQNKGWRIDYFFVTETLSNCLKTCQIFKEPVFSDHAPLLLELDL